MSEFTGQAFIRKRHVIKRENGNIFETCASISLAKKLSRAIQLQGGTVTVDRSDDPKPKRRRDTGDAADKFLRQALREEQAERVRKEQERRRGPNTLGLKKQA